MKIMVVKYSWFHKRFLLVFSYISSYNFGFYTEYKNSGKCTSGLNQTRLSPCSLLYFLSVCFMGFFFSLLSLGFHEPALR